MLTEAVRRKPYSVVLLDEVEKANPSMQEIFYQVFDKGTLQDDRGNEVDFKNTIILLTSNVGTDTIMKLCADPDTDAGRGGAGRGAAAGPAQVVQAGSAGPDGGGAVLPAGRRGDPRHHPAAAEADRRAAGERATRRRFTTTTPWWGRSRRGARKWRAAPATWTHIITGTLLPAISQEFLGKLAQGDTVQKVSIGLDAAGGFTYTFA